jgi:DNA primase small subunit
VNFRTKSYLRKRFGDYYNSSELPLPHDFKRREWGFIFFDELPEVVMRRHKAFSSEGEAIEYLRGMVPAHVYHSAAYYQFPGAGTMKEKKWEGADLIFDLDADHLPQKVRSYSEMLANVKAETGKLLDFLLEDFGFDEENIRVAFSGGRGYHIHVHDPRVLTLESAERREIVDYIGGVGVDKDFMFRDYSIGKQFEMYIEGTKGTTHERRIKVGGGTTKRIVTFENIPGGYGWGKRVSQYLIQFLRNISMKDNTDANNEISNILMNYYLKEVSTDEMQEDIVKQIIQLKKDKLLLEEIVHNVRVPIEKVRKILITNDLWNFKQDATKKLNILLKISQSSEALDLIKNIGI